MDSTGVLISSVLDLLNGYKRKRIRFPFGCIGSWNTLGVVCPNEDADLAVPSDEEIEGIVVVLFRDDEILVPRKTGRY